MNLGDIRKKIDELDKKVIDLLNERTKLALAVGKVKVETGKEIYAPDRESEIYRRIDEYSKGPMPKDALKTIYREIMSASLSLEKPLTIAYLGPEATFTHLAALSKFGSSVGYVPVQGINQIFQEVEHKRADYGVVPIENSIEGAVNHALDMFFESDLKICSEILFKISHNLMSNSDKKQIRRVYSKSEVFGQCRIWLETNLPGVELVEMPSTAAAAQRAQSEVGAAAIGSALAATLYNLPIIKEDIHDFARNVTRFLVISRQMTAPTRQDKTSILVSVKDKVGALYELLRFFKSCGVNMTKIESRPSKKKIWDYYFFIDFEGHAETPRVRKMLDNIEGKVKFLKILGSYPASVEKEV
jgi:chorismate mutase/prephenate dehydratase